MFKYERLEHYGCHSCEQIKDRCVLIHVKDPILSCLTVLCDECLETLLMASKPPNTNSELLEIWKMNNG